MFALPLSPPRFYLDSWASDYGAALDLPDAEALDEKPLDIDIQVETPDWSHGIAAPETAQRPRRIVFVDGVQRIEAWGRVEAGGIVHDAALGSVAVGAAVSYENRAEINYDEPLVHRVYAVGGSFSIAALYVPCGALTLRFEPETSTQPGRNGVSQALNNRRAELEREFAERVTRKDEDALVVLDGRLSFEPGAAYKVVGMAKTMHRNYLEGRPEGGLLSRLAGGERTPVFRIRYGDTTRYSWLLRLPYTRPIHHSLAGLVRLETPEIGEAAAIRLADLTAFHLPRFASRPEHDPRAPQNLVPIGALEKRLRHEMGDSRFLRRAIEDYIFRDYPREAEL